MRQRVQTPNGMRKAARARHLYKLLRFQDWGCYWCGCPIARPSDIFSDTEITRDGWLVWWDEQGLRRRCRIATIEHLHPISLGGTNALENLVAACQPCNNGRSDSFIAAAVSKADMCRGCGVALDSTVARYCVACRLAAEEEATKKTIWRSSLRQMIVIPPDIAARAI